MFVNNGVEGYYFTRVNTEGGKVVEYTKPVIVAQNNQNGSFAAGCPAKDGCNGGASGGSPSGTAPSHCHKCERTR